MSFTYIEFEVEEQDLVESTEALLWELEEKTGMHLDVDPDNFMATVCDLLCRGKARIKVDGVFVEELKKELGLSENLEQDLSQDLTQDLGGDVQTADHTQDLSQDLTEAVFRKVVKRLNGGRHGNL